MADRLTLKGYKDVSGQTGSDLALVQSTKGPGYHMFPRWWNKKGTVQYETVTIFEVTRAGGNIRIVIPTTVKTHLEIIWDDVTQTFKFPIHRGVERIGVFGTKGTTLLQEYQFSRIAGGSTLKRTLADLPNITIGTVTITGDVTAEVGNNESYSVSITGNAKDIVYNWVTTNSASVTDEDLATVNIVFNQAGTYNVTCNITSESATDAPVAETLSVTAS